MTSHDEIGFLIDSFNEMIERLAYAREEAHRSEQQVEKERAHLEAILARLSTGVIATEGNRRIRIANNAASAILHVDLTRHVGEPVMNLATDYPFLEQFMQAFQTNRQTEDADWRQQVILRTEAGRRVLVCASAELPMVDGKQGGHVVVFDDVTTLIQAQRDAAWGEVARRLAHEIKNPLTPIQLSAERIRRRYLADMQDMEAEVLDRATHTIVQQVEAMRDMVNAFSEYARAPEISISHFDLNQLIREVAYLYRAQDNQPALQLELDEDLGEIEADAVRVRQLLHNLIRNAMEAMDGKEDALLEISTNRLHEAGKDFAEIKVRDNGPGIDTETLEELFDPYVTTKTKGTGLGLAIVKKLVEEHGGKVTAENLVNGGACITVCLPVKEATRDAMIEAHPKHPDYRRERA